MAQKDNLTDVVEFLQEKPEERSSEVVWEVISTNEEIITLGGPKGRQVKVRVRKGLLVMTRKQLWAVIETAVKQIIESFGKELVNKVSKKLKK